MDITLIIPAYNEEAYIGACLESVLKYASGRFKEIIVVDNASTDQTPEIVSRYKGVRIVREPMKGLTHARQAGFRAGSSQYLAYIDADCRLTSKWIDLVERHFAKHQEAVSLTGSVTYYDGPRILRVLIVVLEWLTLPLMRFVFGAYILGGNFIVRRDAVEQIGGFNTSIAFHGEDADLARRLSQVGKEYLSMSLVVETSMRRFLHDGFLSTVATYTTNYLSGISFKKPSLSHAYTDHR